MLKRSLIVALLLATNALAEPFSPPEGARLAGSAPGLKLSWEGKAKKYYLQILASGRTFFEGEVSGTSYEVNLQPNVFYTWSVSPVGFGGQAEAHHFQYSNQIHYDFNGSAGSSGGHDSQGKGLEGGPGQAGENVHIYLIPQGGFTSVRIEGKIRRVAFLLLPGSAPLTISAQGGDGGAGGAGASGADTHYDYHNPNYLVSATPGGPGGKGGDGGPGGQVVVHNGVPPGSPAMVKINVEGGKGGPAGAGGRGGLHIAPAYIPRPNGSSTVPNPNVPGVRLQSGPPGAAGQPGRPGSISEAASPKS